LSSNSIHLGNYWRLLRGNPNFRRLWFAQIISESGDWFYMVALYAMLLEFTGRAEVLGLAFVMQVLPQALTGPLAGLVNDRLRRRRVMIFTDLARAGSSAACCWSGLRSRYGWCIRCSRWKP
jgi:MFS family permease